MQSKKFIISIVTSGVLATNNKIIVIILIIIIIILIITWITIMLTIANYAFKNISGTILV